MRNLKSIFGLALVLLASCFVASCNDDVEETLEQQWAMVLDKRFLRLYCRIVTPCAAGQSRP